MAGFYFAWVDETETFGPEHVRRDEIIRSFSIQHDEGDAKKMTLEIKNPRTGLLAPARKRWAWASWLSPSGGSAVPIGLFMLVGVPTNLFAETCTLTFIAKPSDFNTRKRALAETLKVFPFYDEVFIAESRRDDPDAVLEAYSAMIHIDAVTHAVTISDDLEGEDGTEVFDETQHTYATLETALEQAPLTAVRVVADVPWTQTANSSGFGAIPITSGYVSSFTGDGLVSDWPKPGDELGGGWACAQGSYAVDLNDIKNVASSTFKWQWKNPNKEHAQGDTMSASESVTKPLTSELYGGVLSTKFKITRSEGDLDHFSQPTSMSNESKSMWAGVFFVAYKLLVNYDARVTRTERVTIIVQADIQPIVTIPPGDPDPADIETITISGEAVDAFLGGSDRGSYLQTDRGLHSIEYLVMLARAHMRLRARAIHITWECTLERALALSCRKNATIIDHRLLGDHTATGKIISYKIEGGGDGKFRGSVTIGCSVGRGGSITAVSGTDDYIEEDYANGIYYQPGAIVTTTGDIGYTPPNYLPGGLHFPLTARDVIISQQWHLENQTPYVASAIGAAAIVAQIQDDEGASAADQASAAALQRVSLSSQLKDHWIWYELNLRPVDQVKWTNEIEVIATNLMIPKQIDLEAPDETRL